MSLFSLLFSLCFCISICVSLSLILSKIKLTISLSQQSCSPRTFQKQTHDCMFLSKENNSGHVHICPRRRIPHTAFLAFSRNRRGPMAHLLLKILLRIPHLFLRGPIHICSCADWAQGPVSGPVLNLTALSQRGTRRRKRFISENTIGFITEKTDTECQTLPD